jgi:hypothetical protein
VDDLVIVADLSKSGSVAGFSGFSDFLLPLADVLTLAFTLVVCILVKGKAEY